MNSNATANILRAGVLSAALGLAAFAFAQDSGNRSPLIQSMGITQRIGEYVPKDAEFKDDDGKTIHFGDLLQGKPVILVPIFYACRTGCPLVTDSVMKTLAIANKQDDQMVPGRDIEVVLLSIHPKETPELARAKKVLILNAMEPPQPPVGWRAQADKGWHLLTGNLENIHRVTDAIGFKYKYDAQKNLINHATCTVMLTPTGKISSYTIGNDFPTAIAKYDLGLAAQNQVGEKADQSMMFGCIMLDPVTGKYRVVVENVLRVAGLLTLIIVGGWIAFMNRNYKRDALRRRGDSTSQLPTPDI